MSIWTKIIGNIGIDKIFDSIGSNVDRFVTTDKEREELKRLINQDMIDLQTEYLKDRQDARDMYKKDSWLQKVFAITFLVAYMLLTGAMIWVVYIIAMHPEHDLPQWGVAFVSSIWGGMSTKISTIIDFLFGSSQGSKDKDISIENFKKQ